MPIDFGAAFDKSQPARNSHKLWNVTCVDIGGYVLSIVTQFLSNRTQHVMVDGYPSILVNVGSGCRRAVFWDSYCSSYSSQFFFNLEN